VNGVLVVLKPTGMTSHDVVAFVKRLCGVKVGHTGTLDPSAAGVLVTCLGAATRLAPLVTESSKVYRAEITLGVTTDTLDAEGKLTGQRDASAIRREQVEQVLAGLVGELEVPVPLFSAVKRNGRKLYELARRGEKVATPVRRMTINRCRLLEFEGGKQARVLVEIECAKGTYIRSIAALVGEKTGCGGYLSFLLRTRVGCWGLEDTLTLEEIEAAATEGKLGERLIPCARALPHLPLFSFEWAMVDKLRHGEAVLVGGLFPPTDSLLRIVDPDGRLVCLAQARPEMGGYRITPRKVLMC